MEYEEIKKLFPPRRKDSHKGDFGRTLLVCGSRDMPGAAAIAAEAAVYSGAGLVELCFPSCAYAAIAPKLFEPLLLPAADNGDGRFSPEGLPRILSSLQKADSLLVGCGMGLDKDTSEVVRSLLKSARCPVILDADGINAVSANTYILKEADAPLILTPHPGEMARLTGLSIPELSADRKNAALRFAEEYGVVLVLKGSGTVVAAPDGRVHINPTGNPGMARGGSGDMLAGMLASFAAQGMEAFEAAAAAVYLHGLAGDVAREAYSEVCSTPVKMIGELPGVFCRIR